MYELAFGSENASIAIVKELILITDLFPTSFLSPYIPFMLPKTPTTVVLVLFLPHLFLFLSALLV